MTQNTENRPHIVLVVGSTRPVRVGDQLAAQIAPVLAETTGLEVRTVDLTDLALPLLDEPVMAAATDDYANAHTREWSRIVRDAAAIVFLTPQYNFGYPGGLKNAIDYLYAEWQGKPALIISYGGRGGGAGAAQLRAVLEFIGLRLTDDDVAITLARDAYGPDGRLVDPATALGDTAEIADAGRALGALVSAPAVG
ncbi:NADPH-dependent FMN reductase [Naumannella cuiyingiana]|uniref:NAD(P)H-dependent FMN reductase n=1 Tax=Naumannella cuiyingiana TaxID=1347891 RepID=A0A7Z0IL39_9ACTN|nr:NAD(P)H-dependent oxidoreductase [Naumannella cuiyingiana]NYI71178.1 NAD(P)H-dependent FMN reductase [Naumannella cuiyingiana]